MSEKQFDIFDESFREAARQYEPEFNVAAWIKMEAKLDGEPTKRNPSGWLWWFSDIIMIALVVIVLFQLNPGVSNKKAPSIVQTSSKENTLKQGNDNPALVKEVEQTTGSTTAISQVNKNNEPAGSSTLKQDNPSRDDSRIGDDLESSRANNDERAKNQGTFEDGKNQGTIPPEEHETTLNKERNAQVKEGTVVVPLSAGMPEINTSIEPSGENSTNTRVTDSTNTQVSPSEKTDSSVAPASQNAAAPPGIVKPKMRPFKGIYIQALAGPEWSFIAGNKPGPVTPSYGASVGYAFGNRWSVQAGVFSTRKNYEAGPGDYKPKDGSYYANVKIFHVDADCRILEFPLVVNYQFLECSRQTMTGSLGFASLLMKKENYDYHYERSNGTAAYSEHSYQTGVFHPFASVYLGAAYNYKLNGKLSVSASPYLKVPLYGVGEGNVKITSTGLMMGLQYGLGKQKRK